MDVHAVIRGFFRHPLANGETFKEQRFTVQAPTEADAVQMINQAMAETLHTKALITPKDERMHTQGLDGLNNMRVWHTDLFTHFEFEVRRIAMSTPTPDPRKGGVVFQ